MKALLRTKGHLISKCLFSVFKLFQKTNEIKSTWGIIVVKSNFFVRFLGELRVPKSPFEINWPLGLKDESSPEKFSFKSTQFSAFLDSITIYNFDHNSWRNSRSAAFFCRNSSWQLLTIINFYCRQRPRNSGWISIQFLILSITFNLLIKPEMIGEISIFLWNEENKNQTERKQRKNMKLGSIFFTVLW